MWLPRPLDAKSRPLLRCIAAMPCHAMHQQHHTHTHTLHWTALPDRPEHARPRLLLQCKNQNIVGTVHECSCPVDWLLSIVAHQPPLSRHRHRQIHGGFLPWSAWLAWDGGLGTWTSIFPSLSHQRERFISTRWLAEWSAPIFGTWRKTLHGSCSPSRTRVPRKCNHKHDDHRGPWPCEKGSAREIHEVPEHRFCHCPQCTVKPALFQPALSQRLHHSASCSPLPSASPGHWGTHAALRRLWKRMLRESSKKQCETPSPIAPQSGTRPAQLGHWPSRSPSCLALGLLGVRHAAYSIGQPASLRSRCFTARTRHHDPHAPIVVLARGSGSARPILGSLAAVFRAFGWSIRSENVLLSSAAALPLREGPWPWPRWLAGWRTSGPRGRTHCYATHYWGSWGWLCPDWAQH